MEAGVEQAVGETQHHRGVGVGAHRHPGGLEGLHQILTERGQVDEPDPPVVTHLEPAVQHVTALAPELDLAVLDRHPPEGHHQLGVLRDLDEVGLFVHEVVEGEPEDMWGDHMPGGDRVVVHRVGEASDRVEEAVDLTLGVMEATGTGPAVAAAEDGLIAVLGPDPLQLGGHQIEGDVPFHLDEPLLPAPLPTRARAVP